MARIELAPDVLDDFDRFLDHMAEFEVTNAPQRVGQIIQAFQILTHSPLIGRKLQGGKRELLIGQGSRAYTAVYRFVADIDTVVILAVRHQRERGYRREI